VKAAWRRLSARWHPDRNDSPQALRKIQRINRALEEIRRARGEPEAESETIILFQDTSLVYVLSATDLLGAASKIAQRDGRLVEMYLTVALVYMVICSLASQLVAILRKRYAIPSRA